MIQYIHKKSLGKIPLIGVGGIHSVEDGEEDKKEEFLIEIKLNEDVFISRIFPAYLYHPKARYTVDIRPYLKSYLSNLTDILSSEELETTYLQYEL